MKKILVLTLAIAFVLGNGFFMFEGVMASAATVTAESSSPISLPYNVQLTVDPEMSLNCDTSTVVSLSGDIDGMTGGTATGARACTAITNNDDGYTMTAAVTTMTNVEASADDTFGAESSAGGDTWTSPASGASAFGFKGPAGGWQGVGPTTIATTSEESVLAGDSINVDYKAEVTGPAVQASGLYQATTTISLSMN